VLIAGPLLLVMISRYAQHPGPGYP
jgi:hypothetical protein